MATLATLQSWLTEAETALHQLQTGKRVVQVSRDGRRIEYANTADSINRLTAYISDLNTQIAALTGVASTDWRLNRRAGKPHFG